MMNVYELNPELSYPGTEMKEVCRDLFRQEKVTACNGNDYTLLHCQEYPWTVVQIDTPHSMEEWRQHLNAARSRGGFIEYVKGRYDHIVFSVGADRVPKLTQANAEDVGKAIHEAIRNAARWWCLYGEHLVNR